MNEAPAPTPGPGHTVRIIELPLDGGSVARVRSDAVTAILPVCMPNGVPMLGACAVQGKGFTVVARVSVDDATAAIWPSDDAPAPMRIRHD